MSQNGYRLLDLKAIARPLKLLRLQSVRTMATSGGSSSYSFFMGIFFICMLGYWIQSCNRRRREREMNMNPGLAALARESGRAATPPPAPMTYTIATAIPVAEADNVTAPHGGQAHIPVAYEVSQL